MLLPVRRRRLSAIGEGRHQHIETACLQMLGNQRPGERDHQGAVNKDNQALHTPSSISSRSHLTLNIAVLGSGGKGWEGKTHAMSIDEETRWYFPLVLPSSAIIPYKHKAPHSWRILLAETSHLEYTCQQQ